MKMTTSLLAQLVLVVSVAGPRDPQYLRRHHLCRKDNQATMMMMTTRPMVQTMMVSSLWRRLRPHQFQQHRLRAALATMERLRQQAMSQH